MHEGKIVFSQRLAHLPRHSVRHCVERRGGDRAVKRFSCQDQLRCMAFAQLTYRDSLRSHGDLPERATRQALPHGYPRPGAPRHAGRGQREA